jgi:hypothetical protein
MRRRVLEESNEYTIQEYKDCYQREPGYCDARGTTFLQIQRQAQHPAEAPNSPGPYGRPGTVGAAKSSQGVVGRETDRRGVNKRLLVLKKETCRGEDKGRTDDVIKGSVGHGYREKQYEETKEEMTKGLVMLA